ncbi:MAG: DUF2184 domain-containing protein [Defluviitaleaceae bacterium]|nr:DUF2184 domain-containing protein [Defluviitaleaceae bacterium]
MDYEAFVKNFKPDPMRLAAVRGSLERAGIDSIGDVRLDSAESNTAIYHFLRDLEFVKAQVLEVKYPDLTAMDIFPVDRTTPEGAEEATYEVVDFIGGAKIQANHANDIEEADFTMKPITARIKQVENFYQYSFRDIRAAQFANRPLQTLKARASQRRIEEQLNRLAWVGDAAFNILGILSVNNGVTRSPLADTMANLTPEALNDAITAQASAMNRTSRGIFSPDTLALPPGQYDRLFDARFTQSTDLSPGQWILKNNRHIKRIVQAPELMGDSGMNPSGADVAVLFQYNKEFMSVEVPMPPTMRAPFPTLTGFQVLNEARSGGAFIKQPLSMRILTNI